jgi:hypothetical protein
VKITKKSSPEKNNDSQAGFQNKVNKINNHHTKAGSKGDSPNESEFPYESKVIG